MDNLPEVERKTIEEIKRISARQALSIKINPQRKPKITDSKFGGVPYWDMGMEYPKAQDGSLLMLLAQINLDEINREGKNLEHKLPQSGMLQFFIHLDDVYGMDFDYHTDSEGRLVQNSFRVVYHKTVDYKVSAEDVKALGMPDSAAQEIDESPVWGEYGLDIEMKETYISVDDCQFEQYFQQAAKAAGWKEAMEPKAGFYNCFSEEGTDALFEELEPSGHWMLGWPYFTQYDPREEEEKKKKYAVQLFQMDSDYDDDDYIMWGDAGVANFFISEEDLANEDFRDILYSWDCA